MTRPRRRAFFIGGEPAGNRRWSQTIPGEKSNAKADPTRYDFGGSVCIGLGFTSMDS